MKGHYVKCVVGIAVCIAAASIPAIECMNMDWSTQSMPNCVTCTDTGALAGNEGGSCSYQMETQNWLVFCYCNPGYNCLSQGDYIGEVLSNFNGTCVSGACVYAVQQPSSYGYMLQKGRTTCRG